MKKHIYLNIYLAGFGLGALLCSCSFLGKDGKLPEALEDVGEKDVGDVLEDVLDIVGVPGIVGDIVDGVVDYVNDDTIQEHVEHFFECEEEPTGGIETDEEDQD